MSASMRRVRIWLLAMLTCSVECTRPAVLPASIPDPLAYYALDDGSGFDLRDTVSGVAAGRVIYDPNHQSTAYTEPNWTDDERFGKTIQCGKKDGANEQKDTLQLADVDYGRSGAWSLSVWFRHDPENFAGKEREQFIGHGDASQASGMPNHFHVQLENNFAIRTGCDGTFVDTQALMQAHNTNWHQYTFTMRPGGGTGFDVYIDGVLEAQGNTAHSSSPFDPVGPFRLCGREKPDGYDPERYFLGKVAHFAVWDSALTSAQVTSLKAAYDQAYATLPDDADYVVPPFIAVDLTATPRAIGLPIAFAVGLLPGLAACLCAKKSGDWKNRVRARGRRAMLGMGWLLFVLSLTPVVSYVIPGRFLMFNDAATLLYCILMLPVGVVCFMLAATPADLSSGMVPAFFTLFYVLVTLITAAIAFVLGGGWFYYILFAQSLLSVVASSSACCIPKSPEQSRKKLLRLWLTSRIFYIAFGLTFFLGLIDSPFTPNLISWNIANILVGVEFVLIGAVTSPQCRSAITIKISTLGLGGNEEARSAARIVFADLGKPLTSPDESEMATTA